MNSTRSSNNGNHERPDSVEDVIVTEELRLRPARSPDHAAESRALVALAKAMADAPDSILQKLAESALELCRADSAGISIAEQDGDREIFRWHATAGTYAPYLHGTMPRHFSPCGTVLDRNSAQLMRNPVRHFSYIKELSAKVTELLLVPFYRDDKPIGTIWVVFHNEGRVFDAEDARLVTSLSQFASAAMHTIQIGDNARRADALRRETEEFHRFAAEAGRTGSWFLHLDTMECTLSPMMAELMGYSPGRTTSTAEEWRNRVVPDDRDGMAAALAATVERDEPFDYEFRISLDNGSERWLYSHGGVVRDEHGVAIRVHGATVDRTERKIAEEALREGVRRKDEFLATLAHELRNPLAPLRNGLQIIQLAPGDTKKVERMREMMDRQLGHMVRLIDDLLDISRIGQGKIELRRERVGLATLIETALETSRPLLEKARHELVVRIPDEPITLHVDLTRIAQVVSNVVTNAAKYTPEGGKIEIAAGRDGGEIVIAVTDNGVGLAPEQLGKVFEMFSQVNRTLDRSQGGLGIGLALVQRLTEMHGGTITVASKGLGHGSTFTIRIPAPVELPATSTSTSDYDIALPSTTARRRILIVDDNKDGAESLALILQLSGHATSVAHDGSVALETALSFKPEVLLLDIGLPGMNGYEIAQAVRLEPKLKDVVLIAITGWGSDEDRVRSREAGFDFHLTKPVEPATLDDILMRISSAAAKPRLTRRGE